jgi:hypothetical protein
VRERVVKLKEVKRIILEVTNDSMTRMEAWEATVAAGVDIRWENFKRVQMMAKMENR